MRQRGFTFLRIWVISYFPIFITKKMDSIYHIYVIVIVYELHLNTRISRILTWQIQPRCTIVKHIFTIQKKKWKNKNTEFFLRQRNPFVLNLSAFRNFFSVGQLSLKALSACRCTLKPKSLQRCQFQYFVFWIFFHSSCYQRSGKKNRWREDWRNLCD